MENFIICLHNFWNNVFICYKGKMIIARLKWNTPLYEVDNFLTKFRNKYQNKQIRVNVKLTDTECLIYMFRKLH